MLRLSYFLLIMILLILCGDLQSGVNIKALINLSYYVLKFTIRKIAWINGKGFSDLGNKYIAFNQTFISVRDIYFTDIIVIHHFFF